jgi:protein TonB
VKRFNRLSVWIAVSLGVHLLLFRYLRIEPVQVNREESFYEVRLLYDSPAAEVPKAAPEKVIQRERKKEIKSVPTVRERRDERPEKSPAAEERIEPVLEERTGPRPEERIQPRPEELSRQKTAFAEAAQKREEPRVRQEQGNAPARAPALPAAENSAPTGPEPDISAAVRELRNLLIKHQVYPALARRRGWQGTVLLRLVLDPAGGLVSLTVEKTSGYEVLDRAAQELVKKTLPFSHGTGGSFAVEIPIRYSLAPSGHAGHGGEAGMN